MALEDRFIINPPLYVGQIATSYPAIQKSLNRKVLLKIIHPQWAKDQELRERFAREGQAIAAIDHPNVVKVYDLGWEGELPYLVIEWVEGETLKEKLRQGPLPQNQIIDIAKQLLSGLNAVHKAGLVHRDIKPDNILITDEGVVKLADFSLAGFLSGSAVTAHTSLVGTPAYMAPELLEGATYSPQSDLYSLGLVLYEALTGSNPFQVEDPLVALERHRTVKIGSLQGNAGVEPRLSHLIDWLLSPDPRQRPPSAEEALKTITYPFPISSPSPSSVTLTFDQKSLPFSPKKKRLIKWGIGALIVVLILTFGGIRMVMKSQPDKLSQQVINGGREEVPLSETMTDSRPIDAFNTSSGMENVTTTHEEKIKDTKIPLASTEIGGKERHLTHLSEYQPRPLAQLVIVVEPWAEVWVNDSLLGITPLEPVKLPPGTHHLRFFHPEFPPLERSLTLSGKERDTLRIALTSEFASLHIIAKPWGVLFLDGDSVSLLPREKPVYLAPGLHHLRVTHPRLGSWSDTLTFKARDRLSLTVNLMDGTVIAQNKEMESP